MLIGYVKSEITGEGVLVLATCDIRHPELACENTSCCLLLLADSLEEEYNRKHSLAHLHKGERTLCSGFSPSSHA